MYLPLYLRLKRYLQNKITISFVTITYLCNVHGLVEVVVVKVEDETHGSHSHIWSHHNVTHGKKIMKKALQNVV